MGLEYLSKTSGINGTLKNAPEDFVVEEITLDGSLLEVNKKLTKNGSGNFTYFILQKRDWNTLQALRSIGKVLNIGIKRFDYAGTKDKRAITTQLVSGYKVENLDKISLKDIQINGTWKADKKVEIGDLLGNKFTIRVLTNEPKAAELINMIYSELNGVVPNYFGDQRFGNIRKNTHLVGREMILGNFKEAVLNYLTYTNNEENEGAIEARKELANTLDYKKALNNFPKHLRYEKLLIHHLAQNSNDYVNSLRKLPRSLCLMFVHAYQSYIFNQLLSERLSEGSLLPEQGEYFCGANAYGFPNIGNKNENTFLAGKIIGYETSLNPREKEFLEKEGIEKDFFKIKSMPEISSKGSYRTLLTSLKDFSYTVKNGITFSFSLQAGSYATVALREFLDKKN